MRMWTLSSKYQEPRYGCYGIGRFIKGNGIEGMLARAGVGPTTKSELM